MQISNSINNTNFTGTFRIKPQELKAQKEIPELFTQGRQIFHDILEKGDEVIVLRDKYDKRVGKYIQENNIKELEYYPTINTKSGLDDQEPEKLIALMKEKAVEIKTGLADIYARISKQKIEKKPRSANKMLQNISKSLRLNIENPIVKTTKQSTIIRDAEKQRTIEIIAPNNSVSYVYVKPDSLNEDSIKCILDGKGQITKTFTTPNEISKFMRLFRDLKSKEVNTLR